jgi:hypothetical protein
MTKFVCNKCGNELYSLINDLFPEICIIIEEKVKCPICHKENILFFNTEMN